MDMDVKAETEMLTDRLFTAAINCPYQTSKNFLVMRRDILQEDPHDARKQLRNRLKKEIAKILKEVYGRKEIDTENLRSCISVPSRYYP